MLKLPILFMILVGLMLMSLKTGAVAISYSKILNAIGHGLHNGFSLSENRSLEEIILYTNRIPRTMSAIISGSSLAMAGVMFYYFISNDLACPSLIGINYGTYLAIIIYFIVGNQISQKIIFISGLSGGIIISLILYFILYNIKYSPLKLVLIGQALNLLTYAGCQLVIMVVPDKTESLLTNLNGSLSTSNWPQLYICGIILIICMMLAALFIRGNYLMSLGHNQAKMLGLNTKFYTFIVLGIILTTLTTNVILVGPLLFLPLIAVHTSKLFTSQHKPHIFLITSILIGSIIMLGSDISLRLIYTDWEAPLNIFIALIGVPLLIAYIKKLNRLV